MQIPKLHRVFKDPESRVEIRSIRVAEIPVSKEGGYLIIHPKHGLLLGFDIDLNDVPFLVESSVVEFRASLSIDGEKIPNGKLLVYSRRALVET
jgi:hypothetical protein